jgi:hypothetical protein
MFPAKLGESRVVPNGGLLGQLSLDGCRALERVGEPVANEAQAFFPNFWRKRSIRPAVSRNFCLPV